MATAGSRAPSRTGPWDGLKGTASVWLTEQHLSDPDPGPTRARGSPPEAQQRAPRHGWWNSDLKPDYRPGRCSHFDQRHPRPGLPGQSPVAPQDPRRPAGLPRRGDGEVQLARVSSRTTGCRQDRPASGPSAPAIRTDSCRRSGLPAAETRPLPRKASYPAPSRREADGGSSTKNAWPSVFRARRHSSRPQPLPLSCRRREPTCPCRSRSRCGSRSSSPVQVEQSPHQAVIERHHGIPALQLRRIDLAGLNIGDGSRASTRLPAAPPLPSRAAIIESMSWRCSATCRRGSRASHKGTPPQAARRPGRTGLDGHVGQVDIPEEPAGLADSEWLEQCRSAVLVERRAGDALYEVAQKRRVDVAGHPGAARGRCAVVGWPVEMAGKHSDTLSTTRPVAWWRRRCHRLLPIGRLKRMLDVCVSSMKRDGRLGKPGFTTLNGR